MKESTLAPDQKMPGIQKTDPVPTASGQLVLEQNVTEHLVCIDDP